MSEHVNVRFDAVKKIFDKIQTEIELVNKKDQETLDALQDNDTIEFVLLPNGKTIDDFRKNDIDEHDIETYALLYKRFIDNNMKIDGLNLFGDTDIVLKSSKCDLVINAPAHDYGTVFRLRADDDMIGFTRKELALKVMQRYHLMWYLCQNYNLETGKITDNPEERKEIIFRATMYDSYWWNNGLICLQYHKNANQWEFICYDYC